MKGLLRLPAATSEILFKDQIRHVRSSQTRDLLRGLLDRQADESHRVAFAKLFDSLEYDDSPLVDRLLRSHRLFSHLQIAKECPRDASEFVAGSSLTPSPNKRLMCHYIIHRANESVTHIVEAIEDLDRLTRDIFIQRDEDVFFSILHCLDRGGYSLSLARKMAFILGHYDKDSESWKYASSEFSSLGVDRRHYGMMAVADTIGVDFSYLDMLRSFAEYADVGTNATKSQRIAYLSFFPISLDPTEISLGLAAAYSLSLIDAVYYLLTHRSLGLLDSELVFVNDIEEAWDRVRRVDHSFRQFFKRDNLHSDYQAFRAAPAFIEYGGFCNLRAATQRLYRPADAKPVKALGGFGAERDFYVGADTVRNLLPRPTLVFDPLPAAFDQTLAGGLVRSCALARIAATAPDFASLTKAEMAELMGATQDMDRLISTDGLRQALAGAHDDFVQLILNTLLRSSSITTIDSYDFKLAFQLYVLSHHGGNIITFFNEVHALSRGIVEYYVNLLDETMLSQLPMLIHSAADVYETRARIYEWLSQVSGSSIWEERAKLLRIDRKIAAVRGQINETRLNIDGVRFRQWVEAFKLTEISGFIRQQSIAIPSITDFKAKKGISELKLTAHRDPNARACLALMDSYREFCSNADFGIASFLGRRIRHGSLSGALLDALPNANAHGLMAVERDIFEKWLDSYRVYAGHLAGRLHFTGKGAINTAQISAEIDSREKWDILSICLRIIHEQAQNDHGVVQIPLFIEQYCWLIFELELANVRSVVAESRIGVPVLKPRPGPNESRMIGFDRALALGVSSGHAVVASWFRKPPNISPVAKLDDIFDVVLAEAKAEYASYNPVLKLGLGAVDLSGAVYYHLYDALTVVVRNAAKHGAHPGTLTATATVEERGGGRVLHVEVISNTRTDDTASDALGRIVSAGQAGPAMADVTEDGTGIRKLQKMRQEKSLLDFSFRHEPISKQELAFSVSVILSGIV